MQQKKYNKQLQQDSTLQNFHMVLELSNPKEARLGKGLCKPEASEGTQHREKEAQISMVDLDVLSSRLKQDCACLSSSASARIWYIDSRASTHMTGVREYFSSYREEYMNIQITMGNSIKCTQVGRGVVVFQTVEILIQLCISQIILI